MKLTDYDVQRIRELYRDGITPTALSKRFGVARSTVTSIVHMGRRTEPSVQGTGKYAKPKGLYD